MRISFHFRYLSSREVCSTNDNPVLLHSVCPINDRSALLVRRRSSYFVPDTWLICVTRCRENGLLHLFFNLSSMSFWQTTIPLRLFVLKWLSYSTDERLMYNICINKIWFTCCCLKTSVPFIVLYFSSTRLTNDSPIPLVLNRPFRFIKCLTNDWPTYSRGHNLVSSQNALSYVYILFRIV